LYVILGCIISAFIKHSKAEQFRLLRLFPGFARKAFDFNHDVRLFFCVSFLITIVEQRHVLFENDGECGERNTKPDTAVCGSSGISKDGMGRWQDLRGV
jgi:hypothetical protein